MKQLDLSSMIDKEFIYDAYVVEPRQAVVTMANYDIGITVQEKGTNNYLLCLHNPIKRKPEKEAQYKKAISIIKAAIKSGRYTRKHYDLDDKVWNLIPCSAERPSEESCPFMNPKH